MEVNSALKGLITQPWTMFMTF